MMSYEKDQGMHCHRYGVEIVQGWLHGKCGIDKLGNLRLEEGVAWQGQRPKGNVIQYSDVEYLRTLSWAQ